MCLASWSTVFFWSCDAAVPAKVMVSPLTVRLKSVIEALSLKIGPAFEKSSASTSGLIWIWSMMLTPGTNEPLSTFINAALAESSGKSPLSVMSLPFRVIANGRQGQLRSTRLARRCQCRQCAGRPISGPGSLERTVADCRNQQRNNNQANQPGKAKRPPVNFRRSPRVGGCGMRQPAREPTIAPPSFRLPGLVPAGDMQPTDSTPRHL